VTWSRNCGPPSSTSVAQFRGHLNLNATASHWHRMSLGDSSGRQVRVRSGQTCMLILLGRLGPASESEFGVHWECHCQRLGESQGSCQWATTAPGRPGCRIVSPRVILESSYARRIFTASGRNTTVTVTQWQTLEATQTESECATGTCTSCKLSLGRYMKSLSVGVSHRRPL
jgi:hypothetical protein